MRAPLAVSASSWVVRLDVVDQVVAGVFRALLDQHAQAVPQDRHHRVVQVCPSQQPDYPSQFRAGAKC